MSRNYLEALVVAIVAVALGYFLVWPKYIELQNVKQETAEKNAEIKNRQDYYANLAKMANELDQGSINLKKIETALPVNSDAPAFMNFAQATAMDSGLMLKSVDYSGQSDNPVESAESTAPGQSLKRVLRNYSISVKLAGTYANFKDFLSRIERSSRMIEVAAIGVSSSKNEETSDKLQAKDNKAGNADEILDYTVKMAANYYE
jgi:Tfp pilus assembly protein PilO